MNFSRADTGSLGNRQYYEGVLGVPHEADPATVRAAFRDLASKYHPDRNSAPDATSRFREIAEAYAALSRTGDGELQERRTSHAADERGHGTCRAGARWLSPDDLWAGVDVEGVFGDRSVCLRRGAQHRTSVRKPDLLSDGVQAGRRTGECSVCGGTGEVPQYEQRGSVLFRWAVSCASCHGKRGR